MLPRSGAFSHLSIPLRPAALQRRLFPRQPLRMPPLRCPSLPPYSSLLQLPHRSCFPALEPSRISASRSVQRHHSDASFPGSRCACRRSPPIAYPLDLAIADAPPPVSTSMLSSLLVSSHDGPSGRYHSAPQYPPLSLACRPADYGIALLLRIPLEANLSACSSKISQRRS